MDDSVEGEHTHNGAHQHAAPKPRGGIRPAYAAGAVVAIAIIIAVIYMAAGNASAQTVAAGDNVSVYYTGTLTNGTVFDSNVGKAPLSFKVGSGEMIKGFDQGVVGMRLNENKTITLPPDEAYGNVNPSLVVQVPKSQFGNSTVAVGMRVQASSGAVGVIKAVNSDNVTVDFNPELAGQTLIFSIKVVAIKR